MFYFCRKLTSSCNVIYDETLNIECWMKERERMKGDLVLIFPGVPKWVFVRISPYASTKSGYFRCVEDM